jgi:hypothetical protein
VFPTVNALFETVTDDDPVLEHSNSRKVPEQPDAGGSNKETSGVVSVPPLIVTFAVGVAATNLNHIPLFVPAAKQDGRLNVPVYDVLSYAPEEVHPEADTAIALEQSVP